MLTRPGMPKVQPADALENGKNFRFDFTCARFSDVANAINVVIVIRGELRQQRQDRCYRSSDLHSTSRVTEQSRTVLV